MWLQYTSLTMLLVIITHTATTSPLATEWSGESVSSLEDEGGWRRVVQLVHGCRLRATTSSILKESLESGDDDGEGSRNGIDGSEALSRLQRCLVDGALTSLRDVLRQDRVQVAPGVELVRHNGSANEMRGVAEDVIMGRKGTFGRALSLLRSYSLILSSPEGEQSEGRMRRHQYKHMFPLMVMSFMAITAFLVPMGFQFMAVLGGKALLLSKMALMVASMLTYKKLATEFARHPHGHGHSYHDPYFYGFHDRAATGNVKPITTASSWFK